jgi:chemotaxis methyl-accepting protein methylase
MPALAWRECREREEIIDLKSILDYLFTERGLDFSGYRPAMVERRIRQRLGATSSADFKEYLSYIQSDADELDHLIDVMTINVSQFFRDTLTFELIAGKILPAVILEKTRARDHSLRIWSAGCAKGEEVYSLAILIKELLDREGIMVNLHIFATDIDKSALAAAENALYPLASIENIPYRLLTKYFTREGESFRITPEIREMVTFTHYDMLDKKHSVPQESVFGNFDMVFCRNLLIYFNAEYQEIIFEKLYHSLAENGYLVLGEAETPAMKFLNDLNRVSDFSPIYRKRQEKKVHS